LNTPGRAGRLEVKIGEVTLAVVGEDGEVSGNGEEATIGYGDSEQAHRDRKKCDRWWPESAPHRVARVRLVEVDESGKETA
jgi:hypothetical protein